MTRAAVSAYFCENRLDTLQNSPFIRVFLPEPDFVDQNNSNTEQMLNTINEPPSLIKESIYTQTQSQTPLSTLMPPVSIQESIATLPSLSTSSPPSPSPPPPLVASTTVQTQPQTIASTLTEVLPVLSSTRPPNIHKSHLDTDYEIINESDILSNEISYGTKESILQAEKDVTNGGTFSPIT